MGYTGAPLKALILVGGELGWESRTRSFRALTALARGRVRHSSPAAHADVPEAPRPLLQSPHDSAPSRSARQGSSVSLLAAPPAVPLAALRSPESRRANRKLICRESQAGVKDIVLAVNYRPEVMVALLSKCEAQYGIKITFSVETEPLGTGEPSPTSLAPCNSDSLLRTPAGPLALAKDVLGKDDAPFFVLNSDVTCAYPFEELRDFHISHGGEGTIMVSSAYRVR